MQESPDTDITTICLENISLGTFNNGFICSIVATVCDVEDVSSDKVSQRGVLADETGTVEFISWEKSSQPDVSQGSTYCFNRVQVFESTKVSFTWDTDIREVSDDQSVSERKIIGTCLGCGTELNSDSYHQNLDAPSVGFEYYRCPNCGKEMPRETIETG